jgi:hypothetical protein
MLYPVGVPRLWGVATVAVRPPGITTTLHHTTPVYVCADESTSTSYPTTLQVQLEEVF